MQSPRISSGRRALPQLLLWVCVDEHGVAPRAGEVYMKRVQVIQTSGRVRISTAQESPDRINVPTHQPQRNSLHTCRGQVTSLVDSSSLR